MVRKFALLIGNGIYDQAEKFPPLEKSAADVQELAEALRASQIGAFDEVQTLIDEPGETIRLTIERFFQEKKRTDLLLLYLTGHGEIDRREKWYFVCKDTQPNLLASTAVSASFIRDVMDGSHSDQQIVIIDTCYAGAFFPGAKGDADLTKSAPTQLSGSGRSILAATSRTQLAWEGDKQTSTSIFTRYLVKGLTTGAADINNSGWITVDGWFDYTANQMRNETVSQTPRKQVENQQGSIVVAKNPLWVAPLQSSPLGTPLGTFNACTIAWSPDGRYLASGGSGTVVRIWNARTPVTPLYTYEGHFEKVNSVAWSPDGKYIASSSDDKTIQVWDATTAKNVSTSKGYSQGVGQVTWSPDSKRVVSLGDDTIRVLDAFTAELLLTYPIDEAYPASVALSPNGKYIALATGNLFTIQIWDANTEGKLLRTYKNTHSAVCSVGWSPDSERFVTGDQCKVKIWDTNTEGEALRTYPGNSNWIHAVAWSPDGKYIASGSDDSTVQIWNANVPTEPLYIYKNHTGSINLIVWSPDSKRIASASDDIGRIWQAV